MSDRLKGKMKFMDWKKNWGFISGDDGNSYFVHVSALEPGTVLSSGDEVEFSVVQQPSRGLKAINVVLTKKADKL